MVGGASREVNIQSKIPAMMKRFAHDHTGFPFSMELGASYVFSVFTIWHSNNRDRRIAESADPTI
jgi:hypothetical protein